MKEKIAEACVRLLREHNVDEITVRDVAEQCGISRQAFYYYFENIESVLMYSAEGRIELLKQKCLEIPDPQETLRLITRSYMDQYVLLKHLIQSKSRLKVKRYYHETLYKIVKTPLEWYCRKNALEPGELEIKAAFIAYGLGGLLYERCDDPNLDTDKLADEMYRFILRDVGRSFIKKGGVKNGTR